MVNLFKLIDTFTQVSGLKLNVNKSPAMWLGSKRFSNEKPFDVEWPKKPIKALGVYFSYNEAEAEGMNYEPKLQKLKSILNVWKMRNLTLAGKILLIKTYALSQFIYLASVLPVSINIIQQIDKIISNFLWKGGKGFVKRNTIIGNIEEGGLKMVNINTMFKALRIKWVQRYQNENEAAWKKMFNTFMYPYGGSIIFHCNTNIMQVKNWKNVPKFYKEVLISYYELINPDEVDILSQRVWNNHRIYIDGVPCYDKHLFSGGVKLISDLFDANGNVINFSHWERKGVPRNCFFALEEYNISYSYLMEAKVKEGL